MIISLLPTCNSEDWLYASQKLDKRQEKHLTMTDYQTHSTAIIGVTDCHNKVDTFGNGIHIFKDLTWNLYFNINSTVNKLTKRLPLTIKSTTKTIGILTAKPQNTTKTVQIKYQCNPPPYYVNTIVRCVCHQCSNKCLFWEKQNSLFRWFGSEHRTSSLRLLVHWLDLESLLLYVVLTTEWIIVVSYFILSKVNGDGNVLTVYC